MEARIPKRHHLFMYSKYIPYDPSYVYSKYHWVLAEKASVEYVYWK